MTKDGSNARKRAARDLARAEDIPYTEALRRIEQSPFFAGLRDDPIGVPTAPTAAPGPRITAPVDARTTDRVLIGHTTPVGSVAFHPDGATLISSGDVTARLWDLVGAKTTTTLNAEAYVTAAALRPDGEVLAVASEDSPVLLWTIATGEITTLPGSAARLRSLAFSPDGRTLATSAEWFQPSENRMLTEHTVRLWDVAGGRNTMTRTRSDGFGHALAFHPDGRTLACHGGMDGTVQLLDCATGRATALTGHASGVEAAAFSPDGRTLATGSCDATIRLWDLATRTTTAVLAPHSGYVVEVRFSPDGTILASAGIDSTVRLWDPTTGQNTACLLGHTDYVAAVAFSPDGSTLATGSHDNTVRLWTLP